MFQGPPSRNSLIVVKEIDVPAQKKISLKSLVSARDGDLLCELGYDYGKSIFICLESMKDISDSYHFPIHDISIQNSINLYSDDSTYLISICNTSDKVVRLVAKIICFAWGGPELDYLHANGQRVFLNWKIPI
jgi:hypothetical protein